jgi:hypothetical protein
LPKELLVPNEGETTLMPLGIFMGEENFLDMHGRNGDLPNIGNIR